MHFRRSIPFTPRHCFQYSSSAFHRATYGSAHNPPRNRQPAIGKEVINNDRFLIGLPATGRAGGRRCQFEEP
jgi:hypothetical protein